MITKLFGGSKKSKNQLSEIEKKVSQMGLTELISYVKGKNTTLEVTEEGLIAVLKRLIEKVNQDRYFLDQNDDDSKKKKTFDLVLYIAKHKKVTLTAVELIIEFTKIYDKLIYEYDRAYKEIYAQRLKKSIDEANSIIEAKVALQNKMNMIG